MSVLRAGVASLICLSVLAAPAFAAKPLALLDLNGVRRLPLPKKVGRVTVFFFVAHDCPISNGYAPEMNRICNAYAASKIAFYVIYTDSDTDVKTEREHFRSFGFRSPALRDPDHLLVRQLGVTTTPEVAVVGPGGRLLYRGRIDNTYARVGIRRTQTTQHDLRDALDAIAHNQPVPHPLTTAVGCLIPTTE